MCQKYYYGLLNIYIGLIIFINGTTAFRFPNEVRGRRMPHAGLRPPPTPPPRSQRYFPGGHTRLAPPPRPTVPQTTMTFGRSAAVGQSTSGRYWPVTGRQNRFLRQPPAAATVTGSSRQHPQPRTLQQLMGAAASSNQVTTHVAPPSHREIASAQPSASSKNAPPYILTIDAAICQSCEWLNPIASSACCSGHNMCCQHNIGHRSATPSQQPSHPSLQVPQWTQPQVYQPRNSNPQVAAQTPSINVIHAYRNVNIHNRYPGQLNPGEVIPPYDIRDPDYADDGISGYPDYADDEIPQEDLEHRDPRRSSLSDLLGGAAIAAISMGVQMVAGGGRGLGGGSAADGVPQREHRMIG